MINQFFKKIKTKIYRKLHSIYFDELKENNVIKIDTIKHTINIKYPKNFQLIPEKWTAKKHWGIYTTHPLTVAILNNVNLTSKGIVYKGFSWYKKAIPYPDFHKNEFDFEVWHFENSKKREQVQKGALIWDFWSYNNYYHWLTDTLMRFMIINKLNNLDDNVIELIVPENLPQYAKDSLKAFNVKLIYLPHNLNFKVKELLIPLYPVSSGTVHPVLILEVKNKLLEYAKLNHYNLFDKFINYKKIYVSRSKSASRKINNENDLISLLKKHQFQIVFFEDLSIWEQIILMNQAEVIISSHGANLTNILFMNPASKVIEINTKKIDEATLCYWNLADFLDLEYFYIPSYQDKETNYTVSINEVENLIS